MKVSDMLNECIEQMKNMTKEDFDDIKLTRGIVDDEYDDSKYVGGGFNVILPNKNKSTDYRWSTYITNIASDFFEKSIDCYWEAVNNICVCTKKNETKIDCYIEMMLNSEESSIGDSNECSKNNLYEDDFSKAA